MKIEIDPKDIEDLFFKYAFCERCKRTEQGCTCDVMTPMFYMAHFEWAIRTLAKKIESGEIGQKTDKRA